MNSRSTIPLIKNEERKKRNSSFLIVKRKAINEKNYVFLVQKFKFNIYFLSLKCPIFRISFSFLDEIVCLLLLYIRCSVKNNFLDLEVSSVKSLNFLNLSSLLSIFYFLFSYLTSLLFFEQQFSYKKLLFKKKKRERENHFVKNSKSTIETIFNFSDLNLKFLL